MQEKDIEYVMQIAKHRSFSRAAEALFVTQPALSRYIRNLEERLRVKLFDRGTVPLELTVAGRYFVEYAERFHSLEEQMLLGLERLRQIPGGRLRLGVPSLIGDYILPRVLPKFFRDNPEIEVNAALHHNSTLVDMLTAGKLDVAVLSERASKSGYCHEVIAEDRVLMIVQRGHSALAGLDLSGCNYEHPLQMDLKKLENEQFIQCHPSMVLYRMTQNILALSELTPKNIMEVPNIAIAYAFAERGLGFAFILRSMLKYGREGVMSVLCPIDIPGASMPIYLAYSENGYRHNPLIRRLTDRIRLEYRYGEL